MWSETSEQYVVRSEFMFYNLNEGKNYQDVLAQQLSYEKFLVEKGGLQYNRANLLLLSGITTQNSITFNGATGQMVRSNTENGVPI